MKLHLNLALRRAVLAAMATMAVYTTQADETTSFPGGISNGQYLVTGTTTTSASYNNPSEDLFIGGGKDGNADLTLTDGASITANSVNVGNSHNAITGTLTVGAAPETDTEIPTTPETDTETSAPKASVTTNQLNVGCYAGQGTLVINEGASVTVSGASGKEFDSSLNLGYHTEASHNPDTITITGGKLTVGSSKTKNAKVSIGALNSTASMEIKDGGSAEFYGQTIVGENGQTYGTIAVKDGATLNMDGNTVVGLTSNAYGAIIGKGAVDEKGIYDTSISAGNMTVGDKGNGSIELYNAQLTADAIAVAKQAGSYGEILVGGTYVDGATVTTTKTIGKLSTALLSIGQAGEGEVTIADGSNLSATDITLGYASTGNGTLSIGTGATIGAITNLVVGYEGKGTLITESDISTSYTTINQAASSATVKNGAKLNTGYLSILAGTLNIGEVSGEGETATTTPGSVNVTGATYTDASSTINIVSGGSLTTAGGTTFIDGKKYAEQNKLHGSINIAKDGTWKTYNSTTSSGIIKNDGNISVNGSMSVLQGITGTGDIKVAEGSSLTLTDANTQGAITNDGTITLLSNATLTTASLTGDGTTTIKIDSTTNSTASGSSIISGLTGEVGRVQVSIDLSNASAMVNKNFTFLNIAGKLAASDVADKCHIKLSDDASFSWADGYINLSGNKSKLWFTSDYANNSVNQIMFTKLAEKLADVTKVEDYVDPTTGDNCTVTLEYEKQTLTATEKQLDSFGNNADALKTAVGTAQGQTLQTVVIESNQSNTTGDTKNIVDMVIGSGLATSSGLTVQTVVVNQVTTSDDGTGTTTQETKTAGTTGMVLILDGETKIEGDENKKDNNHLGFTDEVNGQTLTATDGTKKKAQTIDLIQVNKGTSVTLSNLNMHSTHNMNVGTGTTITFDNVSVKVGGSEDSSLKYDEVVVETKKEDGTKETKTVLVENKNSAHLSVHSEFGAGSIINIANGSVVEFHHVKGTNDKGEVVYAHDDVLFDNATIVMDNLHDKTEDKGKTTLGSLAEDAQVLRLENSKLSGSGLVQNFVMTGGVLKVGNSPSELSVAKGEVKDSEVRFTLVTDSDEWDKYTGTPDGTLTPTYDTGAISQVKLDGALTLNNATIGFTYEEKSPAGTTKDYTTQTNEEGKAAMADKHLFAEGDSLTLFTGDIANLSGTFSVDYESLPTLADENLLTWDWSTLLTNGKITVVLNERLEEPWRIANTLVSAGDTVLGFGRLAETQGKLRKAGTTRTWGSAIAQFDSIDSGSSTNGYDYNAWGAAVGVDHAFTKNTVVGVAFGCTWGENEPENGTDFYEGGSIDQDAKMIGIYGVHKFQTKGLMNDVKLSAFAAYGWFENDSTRSSLKAPGTATAEWDSEAWVLSASLSRDITTDCGVVFTPYVGVEYTKAGMDDFTEKGRVTTADYTADEDYSNLAVKLGVAVSKTYGKVTPYANIAFISDVDRSAAKVTATGRETITGKSAQPGRNGFEIGVGATWQLSDNLDVNAGYSAEIRDKATEHNARVGIGYTF